MLSAAIGRSHSLGVFSNGGTLRAWGSNGYGQLGSPNTAVDSLVPNTVADLEIDMMVLTVAGWFHSFAIAAAL